MAWASGGTITTSGSYTIHKFTSYAQFVSGSGGNRWLEVLLVAGGGGGGCGSDHIQNGGGGGGGAGEVETFTIESIPSGEGFKYGCYPGAAGAGGTYDNHGGSGGDTYLTYWDDNYYENIYRIVYGGGGGSVNSWPNYGDGPCAGGAGGGGFGQIYGSVSYGGSGAYGEGSGGYHAGGGGGFSGNGVSANSTDGAGDGGTGTANSITGSSVIYGAGGGGGSQSTNSSMRGLGGSGVGGNGGYGSGNPTSPAAANYGCGGGGSGANGANGAAGSQGVVFIRYRTTIATPTLATPSLDGSADQDHAFIEFQCTDEGGGPITEFGICWGTSKNPVKTGNHSDYNLNYYSHDGSILQLVATSLSASTHYYVRSYATNSAGTAYSSNFEFDTPAPTAPSIQNDPYPYGVVSHSTSSVNIGCFCYDENGATPSACGVCWNTTGTPTTSSSKDAEAYPGEGTAWEATISGLTSGTTYHYRSYATNSAGTTYSPEYDFSFPYPPTVLTDEVTAGSIGITNIEVNGTVTNNGSTSDTEETAGYVLITEHGFVWSTELDPTTSSHDGKQSVTIVEESGEEAYSYQVTGLDEDTTYYVRAYAINAIGTSYGDNVAFTTLSRDRTVSALDALKVNVILPAPTTHCDWKIIVPNAMLANIDTVEAYIYSSPKIYVTSPLTAGIVLPDPDRIWATQPTYTAVLEDVVGSISADMPDLSDSGVWGTHPNRLVVVETAMQCSSSTMLSPLLSLSITVSAKVLAAKIIVQAPTLLKTTAWRVTVPAVMSAVPMFPELLDIWHKIDGFIVTVYKKQELLSGASDPYTMGTSKADEYVHYVSADKREFKVYGVPCDCYYTMGVRGYRMVDDDIAQDGIIYSGLSQYPAVGVAPFATTDVDYTGLVDGTPASSISPNFDEDGYIIGPFKPDTTDVPADFTGLFANKDKMGYFASGDFQTYIAKDGMFYFKGNGSNYIQWNGSSLIVRGNVEASSVVASVSLTSPNIYSGIITSSTLQFGKTSYSDGTAGYYIGGTQMNIGTSTNYMKFDGSSLYIWGDLHGTSLLVDGTSTFVLDATFKNDINLYVSDYPSMNHVIKFNNSTVISSDGSTTSLGGYVNIGNLSVNTVKFGGTAYIWASGSTLYWFDGSTSHQLAYVA